MAPQRSTFDSRSQGARPPNVIIHNSLAQNLYRRLSTTPLGTTRVSQVPPPTPNNSHSYFSPMASSMTIPPGSTPPNVGPTLPSSAHRDRSRSGGQTPREMVWVDSKERLSEMATDIRGISNALSNVALSVAVKNVLIVSKLSDDELPQLTKEVVEWLLLWRPEMYTPPQACSKSAPPTTTTSQSNSESTSADGTPSAPANMKASEEPLEFAIEPRSCSSGEIQIYVEDELAKDPSFELDDLKERIPESQERIKLWNADKVGQDAEKIDLIITLGGDGTVLYTSWLFQKMVPPTLSFGLGNLGFMTENEYEEFPHILDEFLTAGICCTLRMRFCCTVMRTKNTHKTGSEDLQHEMWEGGETSRFTSHTKDGDYTILNEVVVDRGPNPFVTMTELYGNFELLTCIKADGVVISTPTGSTAYSMSAGGSLVHPDIPAQLISPICPHTLSFRPLVVPDSMILHIGVPYDARSSAFVSFDGKARVELRRGDILAINVSRYPFPKVLPARSTSVTWVQQLSRTLHWNEQKRPKRYTDGRTDNWQS